MTMKSLSDVDRKQLELVALTAFCNPFEAEAVTLRCELAGLSGRVESLAEIVEAAGQAMRDLLARLAKHGFRKVGDFPAESQELGQILFLHVVYVRVMADIDAHVEAQVAAGPEPVEAGFARRAIQDLRTFGFTVEQARGHVAMFFQIRRAFYFLNRTLTGRSASMQELRRRAWRNIFTSDIRWYVRHLWDRMEDYALLLLGETGTGKGVTARAIGRSGFIPYDHRRGVFAESFTAAFQSINLSEYAENLIESELFGHRKGAFTGAIEDREGLFARCSAHGSVFLDEIGEVSVPVQIKLLNVLQSREFHPVGSRETRRFSGRVIAATNADVHRLRRDGRFRDDLYYRLCSDVITIPPLRQRIREDTNELTDMVAVVVERLTGERDAEAIGRVREVLARDLPPDYGWPGNVRELEQAVRRALIAQEYRGDPKDEAVPGPPRTAHEVLARHCLSLYERLGNYSKVAGIVGLDRRTVKKHIETARRAGGATVGEGP